MRPLSPPCSRARRPPAPGADPDLTSPLAASRAVADPSRTRPRARPPSPVCLHPRATPARARSARARAAPASGSLLRARRVGRALSLPSVFFSPRSCQRLSCCPCIALCPSHTLSSRARAREKAEGRALRPRPPCGDGRAVSQLLSVGVDVIGRRGSCADTASPARRAGEGGRLRRSLRLPPRPGLAPSLLHVLSRSRKILARECSQLALAWLSLASLTSRTTPPPPSPPSRPRPTAPCRRRPRLAPRPRPAPLRNPRRTRRSALCVRPPSLHQSSSL